MEIVLDCILTKKRLFFFKQIYREKVLIHLNKIIFLCKSQKIGRKNVN